MALTTTSLERQARAFSYRQLRIARHLPPFAFTACAHRTSTLRIIQYLPSTRQRTMNSSAHATHHLLYIKPSLHALKILHSPSFLSFESTPDKSGQGEKREERRGSHRGNENSKQ